jgi:hypothetical protein
LKLLSVGYTAIIVLNAAATFVIDLLPAQRYEYSIHSVFISVPAVLISLQFLRVRLREYAQYSEPFVSDSL